MKLGFVGLGTMGRPDERSTCCTRGTNWPCHARRPEASGRPGSRRRHRLRQSARGRRAGPRSCSPW
ncbi:MAG: hypothetical protein MZW92_14895 [Comamonadaceae bacterium]|nr:hypothetical protein [Comamonadaceae bacterium]